MISLVWKLVVKKIKNFHKIYTYWRNDDVINDVTKSNPVDFEQIQDTFRVVLTLSFI